MGGPGSGAKPKVYPPTLVTRVRELYESGLTQAEVASASGVSQKVVYNLMRRHGIPRRPRVKRDQTGDRNASWRGDDVTYSAAHVRVVTARGKPNECSRCGRNDGDATYEWANLTGAYHDVNDYARMCRSCHRRFDHERRNESGVLTSAHVPRRRGGDA